jgi:GxxExxY protein
MNQPRRRGDAEKNEEHKNKGNEETRKQREGSEVSGKRNATMDGDTDLSERVIAAAIDVHRELGPGLLESAYRCCLVHELLSRGEHVEPEVPLAVTYRGVRLDCGYRIDLVVEQTLIVEPEGSARSRGRAHRAGLDLLEAHGAAARTAHQLQRRRPEAGHPASGSHLGCLA